MSVYLLQFLRWALACVFLVSALAKLRDMPAFKETIVRFKILPRSWTWLAALGIVLTELGISLCLLFEPSYLLGFALSAILLVSFNLVLRSVLNRGFRTTCNCFGSASEEVSKLSLLRNGVLIIMALGGIGLGLVWRETADSLVRSLNLLPVALFLTLLITQFSAVATLFSE